jgi:hypothetical protein
LANPAPCVFTPLTNSTGRWSGTILSHYAKHLVLIPTSIRHSKCARHVRHGRGNAIKHFPNVRRAPSKSNPLGIPLLPHCRWTHSNGNRRNLTCKYSTPEQNRNSASASDRLWYGFPVDYDRADVQSIDFPTMLFLDPGILQHGQVEISRAATPVPEHVLNLLGDMTEIRATASKFFEHIHFYLSFVSKKRFYELYLRPSFHSRPDLVLLFLLSSSLQHSLPQVPEILEPSYTTPRNTFTSKLKALASFLFQFCRLGTLGSLRTWTCYIPSRFLIYWCMCSLCTCSWHQCQ